MPQSDTINELAGALAKAQGTMKAAHFNKTNPHFKNKYADLAAVFDAVRQPLSENGLAIVQTPEMQDGAFCLVTRLLHSSGQWMAGAYPLPAQATPQQLGSALTYAKRYSLCAIVGISADADADDDGEKTREGGLVATMPKRKSTKVAQPEDISDAQKRYDERGNRIDCIPVEGHRVETVLVKVQREQANEIMPTMYDCKTPSELIAWGETHAEKIAGWSPDWIEMAHKRYQDYLDDLREQKAA